MKKFRNILQTMAALLMAGAAFNACTSDYDEPEALPQTDGQTYTLSVTATKGADTRALALDGSSITATWKTTDEVKVYKGTTEVGILKPDADGATATLKGTVTGVAVDDELTLKFLAPDYEEQDGTLDGIASTCDYATATVKVTAAEGDTFTTEAATFESQQAVIKFNFDKSVKSLTIVGNQTINVTPASATKELYVAMPATTDGAINYVFEAYDSDMNYLEGWVEDKTVTVGKFYTADIELKQAPLTIVAKESGEIHFSTLSSGMVSYYINNGDKHEIEGDKVEIISVNRDDKVRFYGDNAYYYGDGKGIINSTYAFYVYGNIMSLVDSDSYETATTISKENAFANFFGGDKLDIDTEKKLLLPATTLAAGCYAGMFANCTSLTTAPELPAETLAVSCYEHMFFGCTSLIAAPELPAKTLAKYCYRDMFALCTSLTSAPKLPSTNLDKCCYASMFSSCSSLISAPELPATTLVEDCYNSMFWGCSSLISAPELPAETLALGCYYHMFQHCTELTVAPELPAETLAYYCYNEMFYGCSSLNYVKCLATDISAMSCTKDWLRGVASTGTFEKASTMDGWTKDSTSGIPAGWTVTTE